MFEKVLRGLRNPDEIPPYLRRKIRRRLLPKQVVNDDYVSFKVGRGSFMPAESHPEIVSNLYYDWQGLSRALDDHCSDAETVIDFGCGYGRNIGQLSRHADTVYGLDINGEALETASVHLPEYEYVQGSATDAPFVADVFDALVSWTVLGHIPPHLIDSAIGEIERCTTDDATVVLCEETDTDGPISWSRTAETYDDLFETFTLVESWIRPIEPPSLGPDLEIMVFQR